jgi:hypothetical protein
VRVLHAARDIEEILEQKEGEWIRRIMRSLIHSLQTFPVTLPTPQSAAVIAVLAIAFRG